MLLGYRAGLWPFAALALSGCLRFGLEVPDSGAAGDADADGDIDGDGDVASGCGPFTSIAILSTVSSAETDWAPAVTADELLLFFETTRADESMVYVTERATRAEVFGTAVPLSPATGVTTPSVSPDGLELFYRDSGDPMRVHRTSRAAAFSAPEPVVVSGTADAVHDAKLLADGATLCLTLCSAASRGTRLALAVRSSDGSVFTLVPGLEELDEPGASEGFCAMSADGLEIFYEIDRPGAFGVLTSRRPSASDPFPPGVPLVLPVESVALSDPELSADGRSLYIAAVLSEPASWDLIRASRHCE